MSIRCIFNVKFCLPGSKNWDFFTNTGNGTNTFNNYVTRKMSVVSPNETMKIGTAIEINELLNEIGKDDRVDWWENKITPNKYNMNDYMSNPSKTAGIMTKTTLSNIKLSEIQPTLITHTDEILKAHEKSIAWACVTSFDADSSIDYNLEANKHIVAEKMFNAIMHENKLNSKDFTYKCAFHTNTSHHHMHMTIYQPDYVADEKIILKGKFSSNTYVRVNFEMNKMVQNLSMFFKPMNNMKLEMLKSFNQTLNQEKIISEQIKHLHNIFKNLNKGEGRLNYKSLPSNIQKQVDVLTNEICVLTKMPIQLFVDQVSLTYDSYLNKIIETGNWHNKTINVGESTNTLKDFKNHIEMLKNAKIGEIYKDMGNQIIKYVKTVGNEIDKNMQNCKNKPHLYNTNIKNLTENKLNMNLLKKNLPKLRFEAMPSIFKTHGFDIAKLDQSLTNSSIINSIKQFHGEIYDEIDKYWSDVNKKKDQEIKGGEYEIN